MCWLVGLAVLGAPAISRGQDQPETKTLAIVENEAQAGTLLEPAELETLIARIAFYPDEVIAVTLPAATYPLDIVQAARFLEQRKTKPDAKPNPNWDTSVLALINYPVVISMMNDDLDWTAALGEAVLAQQAGVMNAIQQVRKSAYAAGYLQSNDKIVVVYEKDAVRIKPADPKVVYVPVYQPAPTPVTTTTVVTTTPVYYTTTVVYSDPYTPYYNQAAAFWTGALVGGVTMAFLMDWDDDDIHIDINDGDWDNWHPGDTDINIERGDININGNVNIGNDVKVAKGDSWRQVRTQRTANQQLSRLNRKTTGAQPVASQPTKSKTTASAQKAGSASAKATGTSKKQAAASRNAQQKPGAFGTVEPGQDSLKASQQGSKSRQSQAQNQAKKSGQAATQPTKKSTPAASSVKLKTQQSSPAAFGGISSGKQTQQFSARGSSSQMKKLRR